MTSIAIITGNQRRHFHVANELIRSFDIRGVILETVYEPPLAGTPNEIAILKRHFEERKDTEQKYFSDDCIRMSPERVRQIPKGAVNSPEIFKWIKHLKVDYLVLFGSGIIKDPLLKEFSDRTLNMHLGLSPYYRGSGTLFWPLVNQEPELVGVTIHLATPQLDAGSILKQVRPTLIPQDRSHDVGCKSIIAGTRVFAQVIKDYDAGKIAPVPQVAKGKLYRRRDFNADAVSILWRNLDNGMIPKFLKYPERTKKYPIVE